MIIKELSLDNFRSHQHIDLRFNKNTTILIGKNGAGKTSILEAVYIASQGSSFKGTDKDILQINKPYWSIGINKSERNINFLLESNKKTIQINGNKYSRLVQKHKYPVVLFEPDDLRLINGSPTRRRLFIDRFISQVNPVYAKNLRKYTKAVSQRNSLIKSNKINNDNLFVWDVAVSNYGAQIIQERQKMVANLNKIFNNYYNNISHTNDLVSIEYSYTNTNNINQDLLNSLTRNIDKDKALGYTTTGPHRHDIYFYLNNQLASKVASRGEIRTFLIALKNIEIQAVTDETGKNPIVLLDDIFGELDDNRRSNLLTNITGQVIISTTEDINSKGSEKIYLSN